MGIIDDKRDIKQIAVTVENLESLWENKINAIKYCEDGWFEVWVGDKVIGRINAQHVAVVHYLVKEE